MFKYPFSDKQDAKIQLTEGTDEQGKPAIVGEETVKCTIFRTFKTKPNKEGKLVQVVGILYKKGNVLPGIVNLEGYVVLSNNTYRINSGSRVPDPLGGIHHIEMELIL
jgi:hypothetical protein